MQNRGNTGSKWFECSQCGFDYPVRYRVYFNGKPRCNYLPCVDLRLDAQENLAPTQDTPVEPGERDYGGYPTF